MNKLEFLEHPRFTKELKKMKRKCPSVYDDFGTFKKALTVDLKNNNNIIPLDSNKYSNVQGLKTRYFPTVFKRFHCMKSNRGAGQTPFRLTFVYSADDFLVYFAEFYYKEDKEFEDLDRLVDVIRRIDRLNNE